MLWLIGCTDDEPLDSATAEPVPWSRERAPLQETRDDGTHLKRAIIHLHSPLSHDACDGHEMDAATCLADFRAGLCNAAIDVAFVTDHPSMASEHTYDELFNLQDGDEMIDGVASRMTCDSGHAVTMFPGIEDELMPVALDRHVADSAEANDATYNAYDEASLKATIEAGAVPLQAHTEGKGLDDLLQRQAWGQAGVEIFNLHAMVDPTKREDDLGLGGLDYLTQAGPFIAGDNDAEPDLVFLAIYEEQAVSLERWDALNAVAPSLGAAGTDAHENALPMAMPDGERVDSYRRMVSWFANYLAVADDSPAALESALRERQAFVVFDTLGTPEGFDVAYGSARLSADEVATGGPLEVTCPTLAASSPTNTEAPTISAIVYKDGAPWAEGCGHHDVTEPGVYRVRIDIVPHQLADFLGSAQDLVHAYPWIYSQAFRIGL